MHPVLPPRISCLRVRRGKTHRRDRSEGGGGNCVPRKACGLVDLTRIFVQNSPWLSANVGSIHLPKNYKKLQNKSFSSNNSVQVGGEKN